MSGILQNWRMICCGIVLAYSFAIASSADANAASGLEKRGMPVVGVILIATLQHSAIAPGDSVSLNLITRNQGTQPQRFVVSNPLVDFTLTMRDNQDRLVPQKPLPPPLITARRVEELSPDQEISTNYPVTQAFDLNKVGTYRITAMRKILTTDGNGSQYVVSNTVILHVSDHLSTDFTLTAASPRLTVAQQEPIDVHLLLHNTSKTAFLVSLEGLRCGYTFQLQNFQGDIVPVRPDAVRGTWPTIEMKLQPGEPVGCTVRLSDLYDFSKTGRYYVTAMRNVPAEGGKTEQVYSPTIIITVSPPAKG
ncbi:MAG: hypothetical protein ACYDCO_04895 [Armatimonadota bacterium]